MNAKRNSIYFGNYPEISIAEAREKRAEYRKLISPYIVQH
nr:Arm DNA-binding domain-containing protein [Acinetobacter terrae]